MTNLCQPQGVSHQINLISSQKIYEVEFLEQGQVTLPNQIILQNQGAPLECLITVNDAILRTHQDAMSFLIDNTEHPTFSLLICIKKRDLPTNFNIQDKELLDFFSHIFEIQVDSSQKINLELRRIDGTYHLMKRFPIDDVLPQLMESQS